jgi:ABC-type phosphate transport system substrate-binding protein
MNKTLATLVPAAVAALILSACNGNNAGGATGVAPVPYAGAASHHGGRMHGDDNGPQDLHAGGATFPAYAYNLGNQPVGSYNQAQTPPGQGSLFYAAPTKGTVYYCLTGSGAGRKAFEGGSQDSGAPPTGPCAPLGATATGFGARTDPMDFAASDVAMTSSEYQTWYIPNRKQSSPGWGEPFEFPTIGGPIVYGYRPQDYSIKKIKFSTWTYCAITNGTIGDWNDAAITADNGGQSVTGGVSQSITFYFRSDSSGTSFLFTNKLNTACNQTFKAPYNQYPYGGPSRSAAWAFGVNSTWPGPGSTGDPNARFIGESGNPGVLAAVQSTPFGTGYLEGAWAKSANPKVAQALLQAGSKKNGNAIFADPTNKKEVAAAFKKVTAGSITYGEGSDGQPLGTSAPWCILYIDPSNFVSPPKSAYPIVGLSYFLFYGLNNGQHLSDKQALIKFMVSSQANSIVKKLEYVGLPSGVHNAVLTALNGQGSSQPSCLQ